jgi:hypothetical protein
VSSDDAPVDEQILNDVAMGRAVLFLGAGFALAPELEQGERDKGGLREHLLGEFGSAVRDATLDLQTMAMGDIVLFLETRHAISRPSIEDSIRRFLGTSTDLRRLEAFTLLRTLFERRCDIFDTIITTNWDTGIETALEGLPDVTLAVVSDEHHPLPSERGATLLLKIHGDVSIQGGPLVISSADFDLFEWTHPRTVERLRSLLASRYLLVLGYSAQDENFRRIVRHLHYDLGDQFQGGVIVTPHLADREKLWTNEARFRHIPTTADKFVRELLRFCTTDAIGASTSARRKPLPTSSKRERFTQTDELDELAAQLRQKYDLRHTWVVQPRTRREDTNARVDFALAYAIEALGANAKRLALSTGMTVEYAIKQLDPLAFSRQVGLYSTVIVLNSRGNYRDPSAMLDVASGVLGAEKGRSCVLRASGLDDLLEGDDESMSALATVARRLLAEALAADVIVGSVRPADWYGHEESVEVPVGRTLPYTDVFGVSEGEVTRALSAAGVVGIHQMIPLDCDGRDASDAIRKSLGEPSADIVRPGTDALATAAASRGQHVVLAASHARKAESVLAVLRGRLCNALVVDAALARILVSTATCKPT